MDLVPPATPNVLRSKQRERRVHVDLLLKCVASISARPWVRKVRRSQPVLLLPFSSSYSSVWRKNNLSAIELARPISAHFCFERKGKHLLKTQMTKELQVWRAESLHCFVFLSSMGYSSFTSDSEIECAALFLELLGHFRGCWEIDRHQTQTQVSSAVLLYLEVACCIFLNLQN